MGRNDGTGPGRFARIAAVMDGGRTTPSASGMDSVADAGNG